MDNHAWRYHEDAGPPMLVLQIKLAAISDLQERLHEDDER